MKKEKKENFFGSWLRQARLGVGMNQYELAEKLGFSLKSITNWELGKPNPSPKNMRRISEFFDTPIKKMRNLELGCETEKMYALREDCSQGGIPTKCECLDYLKKFLETCGNDCGKIAWTNIELKETFPLDKWDSGRKKTT